MYLRIEKAENGGFLIIDETRMSDRYSYKYYAFESAESLKTWLVKDLDQVLIKDKQQNAPV